MTKKIPLNGNVNHKREIVDYALVDDDDYFRLKDYSWYKTSSGYAMRSYWAGMKKVYVLMHREICKPPSDMLVDHKNGNPLDNRRSNLRVCTMQENMWNSKAIKNKKYSKTRGITYGEFYRE